LPQRHAPDYVQKSHVYHFIIPKRAAPEEGSHGSIPSENYPPYPVHFCVKINRKPACRIIKRPLRLITSLNVGFRQSFLETRHSAPGLHSFRSALRLIAAISTLVAFARKQSSRFITYPLRKMGT
jgi:hypothetical protein